MMCNCECEQNVVYRDLGVRWIGYVIASYAVTDVIISFVIRTYLNSAHLAHAPAFVFLGQLFSVRGFILIVNWMSQSKYVEHNYDRCKS